MMKRNMLLKAAVAGIVGVATVSAPSWAKESKAKKAAMNVKCYGVNKCGGHGKCGGPGHECAGIQNFADERRVRFALAVFHHLALEEIERGGFAGPEVGGGAGIRGDDVGAEFFNRARVAHLHQPFLLDDSGGGFAGREHFGENILRDLAVDLA